VLIAKVGLDGHDVGARVVARGLVNHGMEVIYTGIRRTPEQIVATALDEDVDVIGVSILSGAHVPLLERVGEAMRDAGLTDTLLIVGGVVPDSDVDVLREAGVHAVFHPDVPIAEIAAFIDENAREQVAHRMRRLDD
jgi:methylmalonyl-CoA mutase C-terminal domain/subunit